MKNWKSQWTVLVLAWLAGFAEPARSQVGVGSPPGWNAAMTKLFGDIKAFSAKAEMWAPDISGQPAIQVPMNFALLDNKQLMMAIAQKQNQKGSQGGKK